MKSSHLKSLLMAAVAAAAVGGPIAADAQPNPDRGGDREQSQEERNVRQQARQKQRAERPDRPQRPDRPNPNANGPARTPDAARMRPDRPDRPAQVTRARPDRPDRPVRQAQPDRARPDRPNRPERTRPTQPQRAQPQRPRPQASTAGRRPLTPERQRVRRNAQTQIQRSFNRSRWQSDFRRRHSGRTWWRNDRHFRGWNGVRVGFYFFPGYGYYNIPSAYYRHHWYAGSYLPSFFWRFRVTDYGYWGLPPAPPGTAWIFVDNWILLVDLWDGYVIEAIPDVWYW